MKVIKRDGSVVDFDQSKIEDAIQKANANVSQDDRASKKDILDIIEGLVDLNKKRMLEIFLDGISKC